MSVMKKRKEKCWLLLCGIMAVAYGSAQRKADKNEEQNFDIDTVGYLQVLKFSKETLKKKTELTGKSVAHTRTQSRYNLNTSVFIPVV